MTADTVDRFDLGEQVVDRDDADPDTAVVVARPDATAAEWDVDAEHTVATFPGNEDYPEDARVSVVVFQDTLAEEFPEYDGETPLAPSALSDRDVPFFVFPAPRLSPVESDDVDTEDTATPDPALVTLAEELRGRGMAVEQDAEAGVLRAEKLGEWYTIHPDGRVSGDGALAGRLEDVTRGVAP